MTTALFFLLEPLHNLHVEEPLLVLSTSPFEGTEFKQRISNVRGTKTYKTMRKQWLKDLKNPDVHLPKADPIVETAYRKLEAFAHLIQDQSSASPKGWTSTVFENLHHPLHWARVAYETNNGGMMTKIHEAINIRWVKAHRQQQESLRAVADSINTMFEQNGVHSGKGGKEKANVIPTPREMYPNAYNFENNEPLEDIYLPRRPQYWDDLNDADSAPKRGDHGVTVKMGLLRYTICKVGKKWTRYKTPALIRDLEREKVQALEQM